MSFWNIYYGTIHFVMPVVALVWLYRKAPGALRALAQHAGAHARDRRSWRSGRTRSCRRGSCPTRFGFVDTAARLLQLRSAGARAPRRPTASRPRPPSAPTATCSRRCPACTSGWSTWSVLAVWPLLRRTWAKVLWALYPVSIFFCIVVTANHWILDAVGGWVVLAVGYLGARGIEWALNRRRERLAPAT